ncbi:MAG TPA: hypothetical protein VEC12_03105, partial [Bacteroidia bacterium]|nr:hypothetical protein [Bacteroidia bacterium]
MSNKNSITLFTLLFLILSGYHSFAQNTDWINAYDTTIGKVDVTSNGGVIVTGTFKNSIQIGTTTLTAQDNKVTESHISKIDSNGNYVWVKHITMDTNGSNMNHLNLFVNITNVKCASNGDFYVTGVFNHTAVFDSATVLTRTPGYTTVMDGFLAKYDENGDVIWVKKIYGNYMAVDQFVLDNLSNLVLAIQGSSNRILKI